MLVGAGVAVAAASLSTVGIASASTPGATPAATGKHALHACAAPTKGYAGCNAQTHGQRQRRQAERQQPVRA